MRIILAQPRGFCAGVERAIEIVEKALEKYGPQSTFGMRLCITAMLLSGCARKVLFLSTI